MTMDLWGDQEKEWPKGRRDEFESPRPEHRKEMQQEKVLGKESSGNLPGAMSRSWKEILVRHRHAGLSPAI